MIEFITARTLRQSRHEKLSK